jgi:hypothetical protein
MAIEPLVQCGEKKALSRLSKTPGSCVPNQWMALRGLVGRGSLVNGIEYPSFAEDGMRKRWTFFGGLIGATLGWGGCLTLSYRGALPDSDVGIVACAGFLLFGATGAMLGFVAGMILAAIRDHEADAEQEQQRDLPS